MPRLQRGRSRLGDILIYDRGTDQDPIALILDTDRKGFAIGQRWLPTEPGESGLIAVQEWVWANGPGGAGTSIETPSSNQAGACESGEFVWLRRIGVAQPAGKLTELTLPTLTAAFTSGRFTRAQVFGANNDLYITTNNRTVVKVPNGTGATLPTETDFGSGSITVGIKIFDGTGTSYLYVSDTTDGIHETANGSSWTDGAAATAGNFLEVPYWTLGDALATNGSNGSAGIGDDRLVVVTPAATGFRHVAGDPKVDANYSAITTVGVGGLNFPIVSTVASNRVIWMGTGLGILGCDEVGHTPNLTKWVELIAAQNNSKASAFWAGMIWHATEQGLSAFRPTGDRVDLPRFMQFGAKAGVTPIYGRPRALAPSEHGLYVGYFNEQTLDSYVGMLVLDDDGTFRWSMAEAVINDQEVTFLQQVSGSDGNPRLFIGTIDTSGKLHLYWQSQPRSGDPETDYLHDGPFQAATAWQVTLSRWNGGRAIPKTSRRLMLEADQLGDDFSGNTVEFQISVDGGDYGVAGTATQSPRWQSQPSSDFVSFVSNQIRLVVANATDLPVIIRSASERYSAHPELSKVITVPILIAEGTGKPDPRVVLQRLEIAQRAGPLTIIDFFGRTIEGIVEPGIDETLSIETTGNGIVVHADVTISYSRSVTRFDVGDTFDAGYPFS